MVRKDKTTWKSNYFTNIIQLLDEYPKVFVVTADNVGSKQMQQIRISLRGKGELLMGKNTMMRKAIRGHLENNPNLEKLLPHIKGNVGFVFTKEDLHVIRNIIRENKVEAPAKAGAIAPVDVKVSPINTGLGPERTSFFQALAIPTRITRGKIEILREVHLIRKDEKVGASEATLLRMLKVYPFSYGLQILQVYEAGSVFSPDVLDITEEDILSKFMKGVASVASVSLAIGYPTVASVPHSIANGLKNVTAVALETDITFPAVEQLKAYLEDPSAFVCIALTASAGGDKGEAGKPAEKKEEVEEEESDDDDGSCFDSLFN